LNDQMTADLACSEVGLRNRIAGNNLSQRSTWQQLLYLHVQSTNT